MIIYIHKGYQLDIRKYNTEESDGILNFHTGRCLQPTNRDASRAGDFRKIVLGIAVMSFFVVVVNRLFWRPLYWYAERKYRLA